MLRVIGFTLAFFVMCGSAEAQYAGLTPCKSASLAVSASSTNVQLNACGPTVIMYNTSSQEAYYNYGAASNTLATTSSYYIPGGGFIVLNLPPNSYVAGITPTATSTFKFVQGAAKP